MKIHPLAEKFPLVSDIELTALATSIKSDGLKEPIVIYEGKILDGRNRAEACERAKVKPQTREFGSRKEDGKDPVLFVMAHNLERRHLSEDQRASIAAEFAGMERGRPKSKDEDENDENGSPEPLSIADAAKKMNVSKAAVKRAVTVKKHGSTKVKNALKSGRVSLTKAAAVAKLPKKKQGKALSAPRQKAQTPKQKMIKAIKDWWAENKAGLQEYPVCAPEAMVRHFEKLVEKTL